jgi:hypothetical protein
LHGIASSVEHVNFEAGIRRAKSRSLPGLDRDVVVRRSMISVWRHPLSITADICATEMQHPNAEAFDPSYSPLNISNV